MEEVIHGPEEFKNDEEVIEELKSFWDDKTKAMKNRFKKKPEYVNAIQFNGNSNKAEVEEFIGMKLKASLESETAYVAGEGPPIFSLWIAGEGRLCKGEWLVSDPHGKYSIMTDQWFRACYEEA